MPVDVDALGLCSFVHALVNSISKELFILPVHQRMRFSRSIPVIDAAAPPGLADDGFMSNTVNPASGRDRQHSLRSGHPRLGRRLQVVCHH